MEQVLDKGAIVQAGKYEDLLQAGTNFQSLVNAHNEAIDGMDVHEHSQGVLSSEIVLIMMCTNVYSHTRLA